MRREAASEKALRYPMVPGSTPRSPVLYRKQYLGSNPRPLYFSDSP